MKPYIRNILATGALALSALGFASNSSAATPEEIDQIRNSVEQNPQTISLTADHNGIRYPRKVLTQGDNQIVFADSRTPFIILRSKNTEGDGFNYFVDRGAEGTVDVVITTPDSVEGLTEKGTIHGYGLSSDPISNLQHGTDQKSIDRMLNNGLGNLSSMIKSQGSPRTETEFERHERRSRETFLDRQVRLIEQEYDFAFGYNFNSDEVIQEKNIGSSWQDAYDEALELFR